MTLRWDTSEIDALALDLSKAPGRMQRKAPKVFARGAFETEGRIQRDATGHGHLPQLQRFVSYDRIGEMNFEIGFDKEGQGNLAVFAVYGSINNAPVMMAPIDHLRMEVPEIMRQLGAEGADAILGGAK